MCRIAHWVDFPSVLTAELNCFNIQLSRRNVTDQNWLYYDISTGEEVRVDLSRTYLPQNELNPEIQRFDELLSIF